MTQLFLQPGNFGCLVRLDDFRLLAIRRTLLQRGAQIQKFVAQFGIGLVQEANAFLGSLQAALQFLVDRIGRLDLAYQLVDNTPVLQVVCYGLILDDPDHARSVRTTLVVASLLIDIRHG